MSFHNEGPRQLEAIKASGRLFGVAGFLIVLAAWELAFLSGVLNPTLLPSPLAAFQALFRMLYSGGVLTDLGYTFWRMALGYTAAAAAGIVLGLILGSIRSVFRAGSGLVDFFRSIPVTALYPLFVLLFGIGHSSKVAMVFWASFFVITLNSAYGAIQSSRLRSQMACLFGASRFQVFHTITFYDALPQTMVGLRVALSYSLVVELLCEMFMGSQFGIGQRITEAYTTYAIDELYALVILAGIVGYAMNRIFVVIERNIIPWATR
jgi:ABC-type nitrate/sulfonate/bicarbonate transport system permease component